MMGAWDGPGEAFRLGPCRTSREKDFSTTEKTMNAPAIREYAPADLPAIIGIWNAVVEAGDAFPQEEPLDAESGAAFFASQSRSAVAVDADGTVLGLYILHPNNVGRCGHIANASYAVAAAARGRGVGGALVRDCLAQARALGFRVLQFNDLVGNCDWTWTTQNGTDGYLVRGRGDYAEASIFLPAAGYGYETTLFHSGWEGFYWTGVPEADSPAGAWFLGFDRLDSVVADRMRCLGFSVRPVRNPPE